MMGAVILLRVVPLRIGPSGTRAFLSSIALRTFRAPPDVAVVEENGILHQRSRVHPYCPAENGVEHPPPDRMQPLETIELIATTAPRVVVEDELYRRVQVAGRSEGPIMVVQVQRRETARRSMFASVIGIDRADTLQYGTASGGSPGIRFYRNRKHRLWPAARCPGRMSFPKSCPLSGFAASASSSSSSTSELKT